MKNIFKDLDVHMLDSTVNDNHIFSLVELITECYCKIKFRHLAKESNEATAGEKVRKQLTKLVLFKHQ